MGADNNNPDYEVDLPAAGGDGNGDDTSRGADTSRATGTGAPTVRPEGGDPAAPAAARPGSPSSAGNTRPAPGHMVPSGLLRDANRQIRRLQGELARAAQGGSQSQDRREPPQAPARNPDEGLTPEEREIKNQLFKIAPFLKRYETIDPDALERFLRLNPEQLDRVINEAAPRSQAFESLYWQRNAHTHLREVESVVRSEYGEQVDPRVVRRFQAAFIDWLETDPEARERYLDGDPTVVRDYWEETTSLMVAPIRDKASSEAVSRAEKVRRLPVMPSRGGPVGQPRRAEKKPKTEDELHEQAWDALIDRAASVR